MEMTFYHDFSINIKARIDGRSIRRLEILPTYDGGRKGYFEALALNLIDISESAYMDPSLSRSDVTFIPVETRIV